MSTLREESLQSEYDALAERLDGEGACYSVEDVRRLQELEEKLNLD